MMIEKTGIMHNSNYRKASIMKFSENLRTYFSICWSDFVYQKGWFVIPGTCLIMMILMTVLGREDMFIHYSETRNGLFCITCAAIWIGIFNSVQSVCKERATVKYERVGFSINIGAYVLAHAIYEALLCLAEAAIIQGFILVFYRSGLVNNPVNPIELYLTLFLILLSSDMLGLVLSGSVRNATTAMTVMPFVLIIQLVMAGVIFELDGIANAISYATIAKWGMTALCSCIGINNLEVSEVIEQAVFQHHFNEYRSGFAHLTSMWLIMIALGVIFVICTILALRMVDKDKR